MGNALKREPVEQAWHAYRTAESAPGYPGVFARLLTKRSLSGRRPRPPVQSQMDATSFNHLTAAVKFAAAALSMFTAARRDSDSPMITP